jgi:hypothetical protein
MARHELWLRLNPRQMRDMSALPDVPCGYLVVPRQRGQQMKDPAQLDAWVIDGTKDYVASLAAF